MLPLNFIYNKFRSRNGDKTSPMLFSEISKTAVEVEQNDNESQIKAVDVPDSLTWAASRLLPAAPNLRRSSNRRVKILTEQTSELQLLSAQENEGYVSDESVDERNSTTFFEVITDNCKEDNDFNYVQELLNNQEIRKILQTRNKSQDTLDLANETSEIHSPPEIANDNADSRPIIPWTDLDEVDLQTVSFEPVSHIFEPQLSNHRLTLTDDDNGRVKEEISDHGSVIKYPENIEVITVNKSHDPLGLTIMNGDNSVLISRIIYGGPASKSGLFREGDEILAVNGEDIRNMSIDRVNEKMRAMSGEISFVVVPSNNEISEVPSTAGQMLHFKSNFSYDPEKDMRPCQDLGIEFQKGDILHVIDQSDPKWWQAYRDDEHDQPLAGLIPSMEFQICFQKAMQKLDSEVKHKKKKLKLRRKSSSPIKEDIERTMPYIAVDVYWPRQDLKRPVVLVGVPNIGIQEICKKFMEFPERFSAAIPRTTRAKLPREVDGEDYHFVTKSQFETSIAAGKFVEFGKFEKRYFGTTFDAVWSIANAGKTCILNISLSSVKSLRVSGLMPYVVLISPPSLERFKRRKKDKGEEIKEKALIKIIDESRELEEKYDHYIDMVLINKEEEETFQQIIRQINVIERDPQWLPASWLNCSVVNSQMSLVSVC